MCSYCVPALLSFVLVDLPIIIDGSRPRSFATQLSSNNDVSEEKLRHAAERAASCGKLWTGDRIMGSDSNSECNWHTLAHIGLGGGKPPSICIRNYQDTVSDSIRQNGYWQDCPALSTLWETLPDKSTGAHKLFLDVGANIGGCLLQMGARPDVNHVFAFEPSPANQFYLTSSLLKNQDINNKVVLYPLALGESSSTHKMYSEAGNAGNTVLDVPTHAPKKVIGTVKSCTLDDIFMAANEHPPYIHLMKMDVQGFEVKILHGAKRLLASGALNAVKFEVATDWLHAQQTSPAEFVNLFTAAGYRILDMNQQALKTMCCSAKPFITDFVAVRLQEGETPLREISCQRKRTS